MLEWSLGMHLHNTITWSNSNFTVNSAGNQSRPIRLASHKQSLYSVSNQAEDISWFIQLVFSNISPFNP